MFNNKILKFAVIIVMCIGLMACKKDDDLIELTQNRQDVTTVEKNQETEQIVVYINGQVKKPGVYKLSKNSRLYQVIDMAGGMTKNAKKEALNLAETVVDSQNIHVMSKREYKRSVSKNSFQKDSEISEAKNDSGKSDLIDINTATKETLTTLPGVGESKAAAIITYREENGQFSTIEDIKKVSGIGDATYDNLKDLITV